MWPSEEDDHMELGNSGWILAMEGWYFNKNTRHTMDDIGREYDENGVLIYDPNETD